MSIQSILNNQALVKLTKITSLIERAEKFEANQMTVRAIRECGNSKIAIDEMTDIQLEEFENKLIDTFKYFNWI